MIKVMNDEKERGQGSLGVLRTKGCIRAFHWAIID
jgi:hypothetical protein